MSECPRKDWHFFGCKFQPRYDEYPREGRYNKITMYAEDLREFMTLRRYVHDVCTRCGKTIERPTKEPTP